MKRTAFILLLIFSVALFLFLLKTAQESTIPLGQIVFVKLDDDVFRLGFLDLQSSRIQYRLSDKTQQVEFPVVNKDHEYVLFRQQRRISFQRESAIGINTFPSNDHFKECPIRAMIGRIEWTTNTDVLVTDIDTNNIAELNLTTCEIDKVYSLPENLVINENQYIRDATLSTTGFIAFSLVSSSPPGSIVIFKNKQLIQVIEDATHPVWSLSGNSLAYVGVDGIYITNGASLITARTQQY